MCGVYGHFARSCPDQFCQGCGKRGHNKRDCRTKNRVLVADFANGSLRTNELGVVSRVSLNGTDLVAMLDSGAQPRQHLLPTEASLYGGPTLSRVKIANSVVMGELLDTTHEWDINSELTAIQQQALKELLVKYSDIFAKDPKSQPSRIYQNMSLRQGGLILLKLNTTESTRIARLNRQASKANAFKRSHTTV